MSGSEGELAGLAGRVRARVPPAHETWNPALSGDLDMRIDAGGRWHYRDSPIARPTLVRLFASIMRREGEDFFLVTPVEKWRIRVDDAPFVAVTLEVEGTGSAQCLRLGTGHGEDVVIGPEHPLRVSEDAGGPRPYVQVRPGLEALVCRSVYYELAELVVEHGPPGGLGLGVWSCGHFFALEPGAGST